MTKYFIQTLRKSIPALWHNFIHVTGLYLESKLVYLKKPICTRDR